MSIINVSFPTEVFENDLVLAAIALPFQRLLLFQSNECTYRCLLFVTPCQICGLHAAVVAAES